MTLEKLKSELEARNITAREIADLIGTTEKEVAGKLEGKKPFYLGEAFRVRDLLESNGGVFTVKELFADSRAAG